MDGFKVLKGFMLGTCIGTSVLVGDMLSSIATREELMLTKTARAVGREAKKAKEAVIDPFVERIETEKAIKAEGIQAKSYAEAKMKLDSIRTDRAEKAEQALYKKYGLTPPQKNDSYTSYIIKRLDLNNTMLNEKSSEIEFNLLCTLYNIDPNAENAKELLVNAKKKATEEKVDTLIKLAQQ